MWRNFMVDRAYGDCVERHRLGGAVASHRGTPQVLQA